MNSRVKKNDYEKKYEAATDTVSFNCDRANIEIKAAVNEEENRAEKVENRRNVFTLASHCCLSSKKRRKKPTRNPHREIEKYTGVRIYTFM